MSIAVETNGCPSGPRDRNIGFDSGQRHGHVMVVSLVCQGHSAKAIGYALGITESAVSIRLERATAKVGLSSRMELVRIAAMLTRDPRARFVDTALTTSEREVLALLERGLTNREIARIRNRSARTIANQVAAMLRKTGSANRKALATSIASSRGVELERVMK
jgi:DNA-binding NarL/FixJ family response regulator